MIVLPANRPPTAPGAMLGKEFLEPAGISIADFAATIGVAPAVLNDIIDGRRRVTPDTAARLGKALGNSAEVWLRLQFVADLNEARRTR